MEGPQQRKRPAAAPTLNQAGAAKRNRPNPDDAPPSQLNVEGAGGSETSTGDFSVEELLSVPLDIIFREVPSTALSLSATQRRKPLLTRAEAQCLVRVSQLSHEVDAIVGLASEALSRQRWCRSLSHAIAGVPLLRSVLPLLAVHGNQIPTKALAFVQGELDRALYELGTCASSLRQYSEQNWILSESLLDAFGDREAPSSGQELAREKRIMAEVQEEVCTRIERLLGMASLTREGSDSSGRIGNAEDAFDHATDSDSCQFVSMRRFCHQLVGLDVNDEANEAPATPGGGQYTSVALDAGEQASPGPDGGDYSSAHSTLTHERDQWSGSTETMQTPERHFAGMNGEEESPDGMGNHSEPEMTQGTTSAVETLAGLASGSRRDNRMIDTSSD